MKKYLLTPNGAILLSLLTLISHVWRGFLDAMFVLPVDFGDAGTLQVAAVIFTLLFAGWMGAIWTAQQGSRRGFIAAFAINALVLAAIPISWLLFYCPAACRAEAGVFNLANSLNLVLGLLTAAALTPHLRQNPDLSHGARHA